MKHTLIYRALFSLITLFWVQNKLEKLSHHCGEFSQANDNLYKSCAETRNSGWKHSSEEKIMKVSFFLSGIFHLAFFFSVITGFKRSQSTTSFLPCWY